MSNMCLQEGLAGMRHAGKCSLYALVRQDPTMQGNLSAFPNSLSGRCWLWVLDTHTHKAAQLQVRTGRTASSTAP